MHSIVWFWAAGIHDPVWVQAVAASALVVLTLVTLLVLSIYAWDTHTLARTSVEQISILRQSVAVAKHAADAAEIQARAAMGVAVPTLVLAGFGFAGEGERTIEEKLGYPEMRVLVRNLGQTPATLKTYGLKYSCEAIPPNAPIPVAWVFEHGEVIDADEPPYVLEDGAYTKSEPFSKEEVAAVLAEKKTVVVAGCLSYGDVFGSPVRELRFCKDMFFSSDGVKVLWQDSDLSERYRASIEESEKHAGEI